MSQGVRGARQGWSGHRGADPWYLRTILLVYGRRQHHACTRVITQLFVSHSTRIGHLSRHPDLIDVHTGNEDEPEDYARFLTLLGDRIELNGWNLYAGNLSTGACRGSSQC